MEKIIEYKQIKYTIPFIPIIKLFEIFEIFSPFWFKSGWIALKQLAYEIDIYKNNKKVNRKNNDKFLVSLKYLMLFALLFSSLYINNK